ncbi:MAG: ABC transporter permease [Deltaproteobacteria bacterium]|nr:ABC transporter permease [Deltaproteobacteria bacterium]
MSDFNLTILLASVVAGAVPILLATLGETITEKSGIINLSLDGSILLSAMIAFAVAYETGSTLMGFACAALTGALVAAVVAVFSIYLNQSQVAVGFVLTLMTRDLAYFLGNPYSRIQGPSVLQHPIPLLSDIPFLGKVFFSHTFPVYLSLLLIGVCWWYVYRTAQGLNLRAVGENPRACFARGISPARIQMLYAVCGGAFVGLAGAAFSLCTKPGWGRPQGAEGTGWIALALVIFGGWHPVRAAIGAYLFAFLQVIGIYFQNWFPSIPAQVFQVAPFPLMIFTLLIINFVQKKSAIDSTGSKVWMKSILGTLSGAPPTALGKSYRPD